MQGFASGRLKAGAFAAGGVPASIGRFGPEAANVPDLSIPAAGQPGAWRAVSYLSAFDPANGPEDLLLQMRETDAAAMAMPSLLMRRFVDSGSAIGARGAGSALRDLEELAGTGGFDILLVQHVSRFAADYAVALGFAVDMVGMGVRIVETRGGPVRFAAAEAELVRGARR